MIKYRLGVGTFLAFSEKNKGWLDLQGTPLRYSEFQPVISGTNNGHPEGRPTSKAAANDIYLWR